MDYKAVHDILWSVDVEEALQSVLLEEFQREMQENGLSQIETDYETGWNCLSELLHGEQSDLLEDLEVLCSEEAKIAFRIAFERGQYAGFQSFFQPDSERLTLECFVLDKLLTVPEMKQFPDYYEAKIKVNELETELADQLDPFSREHLTSITYAWEERTTAMLRYGFALGYQEALEVIGQVEPKRQTQISRSVLKASREAGMILTFKPKQ